MRDCSIGKWRPGVGLALAGLLAFSVSVYGEPGDRSSGNIVTAPTPVGVIDATRLGGREDVAVFNLAAHEEPIVTRLRGVAGSGEVREMPPGSVAEPDPEMGTVVVYNAGQTGYIAGCWGGSPCAAYGDQMLLEGIANGGGLLESYSFGFAVGYGAYGYRTCFPDLGWDCECYDGNTDPPYTVDAVLYDGPLPGSSCPGPAGSPIEGTRITYQTTNSRLTGYRLQVIDVELRPKVFVPKEVWLSVMISTGDNWIGIGATPDVGQSPYNADWFERLCDGGDEDGQVCWPDAGDYETCLGNICQGGFSPGIACDPLLVSTCVAGGGTCDPIDPPDNDVCAGGTQDGLPCNACTEATGTCPPGKGTCDDCADAWQCWVGPVWTCADCQYMVASAIGNAGMVVSLVPVEAHGKPGDIKDDPVGTIIGDEIFLEKGGANVWLEIMIGDWTATGVGMNAWSVDIDKSGFSSGLYGTLTVKSVVCDNANPDMGDSDCIQALGPGATWAAPQPPRLCIMPIGSTKPDRCAPAFADVTRPDWVSPAGMYAVNADILRFGSTQAGGTNYPPSTCQSNICDGGTEEGLICDRKNVDDQCVPGGGVCPEYVCTTDMDCWAVAYPNACNQGYPAAGLYAGTLVVEVPDGVKGTFEIDLMNLVFVDLDMQAIPLIGTRSAKITVEVGKCCYGIGMDDKKNGCIEDLTQNQCNEAGWCKGYCEDDPSMSTAPGCVSDYNCVRDGFAGPCIGGATLGDPCLASGDKDMACDDASGEVCEIQQKTGPIDPDGTCADPCPQCVVGQHNDCRDGDACTVDRCTPEGVCTNEKVNKGAGDCCDPNTTDKTTDVDGLGEILPMDDANVCTADTCSKGPNRGVPVNTPTPDVKCWDASFVNKCIFTGWCDATGACVADYVYDADCMDDDDCSMVAEPQFIQDYTCDVGTKTNTMKCICCKDNSECDDLDDCTTDTCVNNDCVFTQISCDDQIACTKDSCLQVGGCVNDPVDANCDDGVVCTKDACDKLGAPGTGCNNVPVDANCDDMIACTKDSCDQILDCVFLPVDANCDDGIVCTNPDICVAGVGCVITPVNSKCDDGIDCTNPDVCDPNIGCVITTVDSKCDDGIDCTNPDICVEGVGCVITTVDSKCDDGIDCTNPDICVEGVGCVITPVNSKCDDGIDCTNPDMCIAGVGCIITTVDSKCDDGIDCTNPDICVAGVGCVITTVDSKCDDSIDCTKDTCSAVTDCVFTPVDANCDDGLFCTSNVCDAGTGCVFDKIPAVADCDDGDACTLDRCKEVDPPECEYISLKPADIPHEFTCTAFVPDCDDAVNQRDGSQVASMCLNSYCASCVCDTDQPCYEADGTTKNVFACGANLDLDIHDSTKDKDIAQDCFVKDEKITVDIVKTAGPTDNPIPTPINGGTFVIYYDPDCMTFQSISGVDPYTFEMWEVINEVLGRIEYSIGISPFAGKVCLGGPNVGEPCENNYPDCDYWACGPKIDGRDGYAVMAQMTFTKSHACTNCDIWWEEGGNPIGTSLVNDEGQSMCTWTTDSKEIHQNDVITLDVPEPNIVVNADCDAITAMVSFTPPSAASNCYDPESQGKDYEPILDCNGWHPGKDGLFSGTCSETGASCVLDQDCDPHVLAPEDICVHTGDDEDMGGLIDVGGGLHAAGTTSYGCTATSNVCGDWYDKFWTVEVTDTHAIDVLVELEPEIINANLTRCIKFELFTDTLTPPLKLTKQLVFGNHPWNKVGRASIDLKEVGNWTCMTARDQHHSLRSCTYLECLDGVYVARFIDNPLWEGNWLIGGNLDGWKKDNENASLDVIDITDFGQFVAVYNEQFTKGTPCPTQECTEHVDCPVGQLCHDGLCDSADADINGDGIIDTMDFLHISMNFFVSSKLCCEQESPPGGVAVGRTEISVRELRETGMSDLAVGDLNNDGWLNMDDIAAFMAGERPTRKAPGTRRSSGLR